jgi:phosphoglycolate phosphatase
MVGEGFKNLMRRALPDSAVSDDQFFSKLTKEATSAYGIHSLVETKPFGGIPELLSGLSSRGLSLAILSNKPDPLAKSISKALFGSFSFIEVMGELEGRPRKPDPTAALEIAKKSGTEPSQWAYIGDSGIDMKTAVSSGMVPFGAAWGYRSETELTSSGARYLVRSPLDLLEYIM